MSRPRSSFESPSPQDLQAKEDSKLRQIIPKFFTKAALTIVSARAELPHLYTRDNRLPREDIWFNLKLDDTDVLAQHLVPWADCDPLRQRPPPLVIEIYLDTAELSRNQSLVVVDERGRKWDVGEALATAGQASTPDSARTRSGSTEVVLERWKVFLDEARQPAAAVEGVPHTYKKAVVMFRALFTYARFLPAWKFSRRLAQQPTTLTSLRPLFRVLDRDAAAAVTTTASPATAATTGQPRDSLRAALYPSPEPTWDRFCFHPTMSAVGALSIEVAYRLNCDFRVDDAESMLSSHFIGIDNDLFRPSLAEASQTQSGKLPGSLPADRRVFRDRPDRPDLNQAYGSMSTFHNLDVPTGTSPISTLRQVSHARMQSQPESPPSKAPASHRLSQASQGSKSSLRSGDGPPFQRRVSVSFQPFKAGSLSSSPAPATPGPPSPRPQSARTSDPLGTSAGQARQRNSLVVNPQAALRIPPPAPAPDVAVASPSSSSPKAPPITRYSSSFGHRRSRFSSGGGSAGRPEDDNNSSGRTSQLSNQPGSGLLAEGDVDSAESLHTDDDNISDFLKMLEQDKDLKSFNRNDDASREASAKRTSAALSRYHQQRDSYSAFSESLSSSTQINRSPSISSRNVPPTLAGNSVSSSSSPNKPLSPYTPHTPAIPSRLGAGSIPAYTDSPQYSGRGRISRASDPEEEEQSQTDVHSSGAIDIPTSPQRWPPFVRRSSSAAQRQRDAVIEDEFGMRSASLGNAVDDRPDLSLSELIALQNALTSPRRGPRDRPDVYASRQMPPIRAGDNDDDEEAAVTARRVESRPTSATGIETSVSPSPSASASASGSGSGPHHPPFRSRLSRAGGGGGIGTTRSSFDRGGGSALGRYSFSARRGDAADSGGSGGTAGSSGLAAAPGDDDEPLLFDMSELGSHQWQHQRRGSNSRR